MCKEQLFRVLISITYLKVILYFSTIRPKQVCTVFAQEMASKRIAGIGDPSVKYSRIAS